MVGRLQEVNIEKIVAGGDGLAHLVDGRVLFVPYSLPGERLKVRIIEEKKDYAVGEIDDILTASPHRVEPRCPHYRLCGGCELQHVSYTEEIRIKESFLVEVIQRQARLDIAPEANYPSPLEWGYRSKSEHPAAPSTNRRKTQPLIGYYEPRSHRVVNVESCPVLDPSCVDDLKKIRSVVARSAEPLYDEGSGVGNLRHVVLRRSSPGERMVGLVTRTDRLKPETIRRLLEEFGDLSGIVQNTNPDPVNRILGDKSEIISGLGYLVEEIAGLKLKVSLKSFFQANHSQAQRIVELVREFLQPQSADTLCDVYAGVGMIGLALAHEVKRVVALESSTSSVSDGRQNVQINSLPNVTWIEGDAGQAMSEITSELLVLDPPRKGLDGKVLSAIVKNKPGRVSYVSCNASTWARDIRLLADAGYKLKRLAWLDMFPKTAHVELVSFMEAS